MCVKGGREEEGAWKVLDLPPTNPIVAQSGISLSCERPVVQVYVPLRDTGTGR